MLTNLAVELQRLIIDHIDDRNHVLTLALTSRSLSALCIPDVLPWREIRVRSLNAPDLWKHITDFDFHARQIRSLVIGGFTVYGADKIHKRTTRGISRIPSPFVEARAKWVKDISLVNWELEDEKGERKPYKEVAVLLVSALRKMENLRSLVIGPTTFPTRPVDNSIWTNVLPSYTRLRVLILPGMDYWVNAGTIENVCSAKNLTVFKASIEDYTPEDIGNLLDGCPLLHTVHFEFNADVFRLDLSDIFATRTLPQLCSLGLSDITCNGATFAAFLGRHPRLHTLDLSNYQCQPVISPAELMQHSLPSLHKLAVDDGNDWIVAAEMAGAPLREVYGHALHAEDVKQALLRLKGSLKRVVFIWNRHGDQYQAPAGLEQWFEMQLPQVEVYFSEYVPGKFRYL